MASDTPALAAFAALHREQRGALGVIAGPGGPLLGNLSVSDLRGLRPECWGALALPVRAKQKIAWGCAPRRGVWQHRASDMLGR